jgi:hypothetical protein
MAMLSRWARSCRSKPTATKARYSTALGRVSRTKHRVCSLEPLESRALLSAASLSLADIVAHPAASGCSVGQITSAYLARNLSFVTSLKGAITGDGYGQTIAIVDAYNNPNIVRDLTAFDTKFNLAAPNITIVNQTGGSILPSTSSDWGLEIALDVEWAHAIAPKANILLVEANSASLNDLLTAVNYARNAAGVSVVSMSWGTDEFRGETSYDSYFTTPSGHAGVTFIASSGDDGVNCWPSVASNVLSVGGTTLSVSSSGVYASETAWSGSGGGVSRYESLPSYQKMIGISASGRVTPDVAYDANPSTGFLVYDSLGYSGWLVVGGTSAGAPQWAAIVAIANEARVANGLGTLSQTNAMLYTIYASRSSQDFHDVTSGRNSGGFSATKGYDAVTGLGSPIVASLLGDLAKATATTTGKNATTTITIGSGRSSGGWGMAWGGSWGSGWGRFYIAARFGGLWDPAALAQNDPAEPSISSPGLLGSATDAVAVPTGLPVAVSSAVTMSREVWAERATIVQQHSDEAPAAQRDVSAADSGGFCLAWPSNASRPTADLTTSIRGHVVDLLFAESLSAEINDAAILAVQPSPATERVDVDPAQATDTPARVAASATGAGGISTVEHRVWEAAALLFAWQVRSGPAELDADHRRVRSLRSRP